jgi:hypothetical protein
VSSRTERRPKLPKILSARREPSLDFRSRTLFKIDTRLFNLLVGTVHEEFWHPRSGPNDELRWFEL